MFYLRMALVKGSQNAVLRSPPLTAYLGKKEIPFHSLISGFPPPLFHFLVCERKYGTSVEWGCVHENKIPVSEEPNAERAGVLI